MSRWWPLGTGDALAGDPDGIRALASRLELVAEACATERRHLADVRPDDVWTGRAAAVFAHARSTVDAHVQVLAARMARGARGVHAWAGTLADLQARGDALAASARRAQADLDTARLHDDPGAAADAHARLRRARTAFAELVDDHHRLARHCAHLLRDAATDDLADDWWQVDAVGELARRVLAPPTQVRFRVTGDRLDLADQRPDLEQILLDHQTADDPGGRVDYGPKIFGRTPWGVRRMTRTEAETLVGLSPDELYDMRRIRGRALAEGMRRHPVEGLDKASNFDHQDAFRHAYWTAMLARRFGEGFARWVTTVHEGLPGNSAEMEAMDLYNNQVGLQVQASNPEADDDELADLVEAALMAGRLVVIDQDGRLAWADEVAPGETGQASEGELPGRPPPEYVPPRPSVDPLDNLPPRWRDG